MRRELSRVLILVFVLGGGAVDREASVPDLDLRGLDTLISEFPRRIMDVRQMVEIIGQECGLGVVLDDRVGGQLSVEHVPGTGRSILNAALPDKGLLYLMEKRTLRVMPEDDLRAYFRSRAVSRSYATRVTPDLMRSLLETPDLVSTMGYLAIDPEHGIVRVHDLPWFAARVEVFLGAWADRERLVTL